jgi:hypothetical protein
MTKKKEEKLKNYCLLLILMLINLMCHPSGILFNPCTLSKAKSSETIAPSTAKAEAAISLTLSHFKFTAENAEFAEKIR